MATDTVQKMDEIPYFYNKEGVVPLWDHPLLSGYKILPKGYKPYTTIEAVLSLYIKRLIDDEDIMILKVLGDAICCNENQLRRYLSPKMTNAQVSKRLDKFRYYGLVDRWKVKLQSTGDDYEPPPAPFTLGIAGYKLLKHYYNQCFFMDPNRWDTLGIGAVQRYVAMNEIRCMMFEKRSLANWKWNALINSNNLIRKPLGVAEVKTPRGNLNFFIERAQMNQDFIGFLRDKLYQWTKVYEQEKKSIVVNGFEENQIIVIIYASTLSIAEVIHKELLLDTFPFSLFVCVEEDLVTDGLATSFYQPTSSSLDRKKLAFFN